MKSPYGLFYSKHPQYSVPKYDMTLYFCKGASRIQRDTPDKHMTMFAGYSNKNGRRPISILLVQRSALR